MNLSGYQVSLALSAGLGQHASLCPGLKPDNLFWLLEEKINISRPLPPVIAVSTAIPEAKAGDIYSIDRKPIR